MGEANFWADRRAAEEKLKRAGELKNLLERYRSIEKEVAALTPESDEKLFYEAKKKFRMLELETLFRGPHDRDSAIIGIFPGAGGEDAVDWARMLEEMYRKYAAERGWRTTTLDESPNHRLFEVKGEYAYGFLKHEAGVHRLVRISPTSAKKLRHTSFALVEILPDLPEIDHKKIEIPEKDLEWEFSRSGGPGGQNVNKVETAVRVVHIPTGITVHSQTQRSQAQNRERALSILKAKLLTLMEKQQIKELAELRTKVKPAWGNQIRSYVLNPYKLVKDHRTGTETADVEGVLDGKLDMFIESEIDIDRK